MAQRDVVRPYGVLRPTMPSSCGVFDFDSSSGGCGCGVGDLAVSIRRGFVT